MDSATIILSRCVHEHSAISTNIYMYTLVHVCPDKHVLMFPMNQSLMRLNNLKTS